MIRIRISHPIPKIIGILMMIHGINNFLLGVFLFISNDTSTYQEVSQLQVFNEISSASDIVSILLGMAIIFLGLGLFHRKKVAWFWALIIQFLVLINSCIPPFSLHAILVSLLLAVVLIIFRKEFSIRNAHQQSIDAAIAWISIVFALSYGMIGSYLMRAQFHGLKDVVDAFYFTMVTYSTLGYGDIVPMTDNAKMFTASMIIIGITSFVATLTLIIGPMVQQRVRGVYRIMSKLDRFTNHVVIAGFNDLTIMTAKDLIARGSEVLFLEKDRNIAEEIKAKGFHTVIGDSTHPEELTHAHISHANFLICGYAQDAQNILTLIAAHGTKSMHKNPGEFKIICRIEEPHNIPKAKQLGADIVIAPSQIAGEMMAKAVGQKS